MRFTFILAIFLFLFSSLLATATPIGGSDVEERQTPEAYAIFETLKSRTDTILPQISEYPILSRGVTARPWRPYIAALKAHNNVTYDNVAPLINELIGNINTATSSIKSLSPSRRELVNRQSGDQLADLVAGIVEVCITNTCVAE
jgi:hypothetical protein